MTAYLRTRLAEIDKTIAAERQVITDLRRQLDQAIRPATKPAVTCGAHAVAHAETAAMLRTVLGAHQTALTKASTQRDRLASELESTKRLSSHGFKR